jgi:predicted esterase
MGLVVLGSLALSCTRTVLLPGGRSGGGGSTSIASGDATAISGSGTGGAPGTGGAVPGTGGRETGGASPVTVGNGGWPGTGGGISGTGGSATIGTVVATGGRVAAGGATGATSSGGNATGGAGGAATGGSVDGGSVDGGGVDGGGAPIKSSGCGAPSWPTSNDGLAISVGGANRTYNLRIPDDYDTNHPYRLIVSYHWLGGTANDVSNGSSMAKAWYGLWDLAAASTIFVAPQGVGNAWPNASGQDVEFSRQLLIQLGNQLCVDQSRILAEGFSMGGSMAYAMACALGDTLRGVAVHSGGAMSGCVAHSKPVAYFMTHGTNDSVCVYPMYGVPQLADFAKLAGCTTTTDSLPAPAAGGGGLPACLDFAGCSVPVRACLFVGDHTPSPGGPSTTWVPAETWKFFSQL